MKTALMIMLIVYPTTAFAEFTCAKEGKKCPGQLCIENTPDQCVNGMIAARKNGVIILRETRPGSSNGFKEFLEKQK